MAVLYAEDISPGTEYALAAYEVTEDEMTRFASEWDPQGFHVDHATARQSAFGELIASGVHTLAICNRLSVAAVFNSWAVIAGRRLTDVQFYRPVTPGIITGTLEVLDVTIDSERRRGVVTTHAEILDAPNSHLLFSMNVHTYVHSRPTN